MTLERRLAMVEASLGPLEIMRRWLAEAHGYDDFHAYFAAMHPLGIEGLPLDRLVLQAKEAAEANRSIPFSERGKAAQTAMRSVIFLFQLALRALTMAEDAIDREGLRYAALTAQLGLVVTDGSFFPSRAEGLATLREAAIRWANELRATETARTRVEVEYFGGTPVLYPATARRWVEQRQLSDGLVDLIARIAAFEDDLPPPPPDDPVLFEARVVQLIANHVEPARVKALDEMGEGRRAASIALRWLAPKAI
jgi:hypothetical protein